VTSLADLGLTATMMDVDLALQAAFEKRFGPVRRVDMIPSPRLRGEG
jgi:hypothetical protein